MTAEPAGFTLRELAERLGGAVEGDPEIRISGAAGLEDAAPGSIVRVENARYLARAVSGGAEALLMPPDLDPGGKPCIRVENVRLAFVRCLQLFEIKERKPADGIHPTAVIAASAVVDPTCSVGPYAVIGENAKLGRAVVVHAHAVVGDDVEIGEESAIFPHAVLYARTVVGARVRIHAGAVLGSDGFGYDWTGERHQKWPHNGRVVVGDDVEIGANGAVDRATSGSTVIGPGTKVDNLVQIGHNCRIGAHCIVIAQAGMAGTSELGNGVMMAGQAGLAPRVKIGDGVKIGAQSGLMRDVPAGTLMFGTPARPHHETLRIIAALPWLPDLLERVRRLEKLQEMGPGHEAKE